MILVLPDEDHARSQGGGLIRWTLAVLLAVHGLIHFMGFAKAFGYAEFAATHPARLA